MGTNDGASICKGCSRRIEDKYVLRIADILEWHASCLKCFICQIPLHDGFTCFLSNGQPCCKADYTRLFSKKCEKCKLAVKLKDLVIRTSDDVIYHVTCFRCHVCGRQLKKGETYLLSDQNRLTCQDDLDSMLLTASLTDSRDDQRLLEEGIDLVNLISSTDSKISSDYKIDEDMKQDVSSINSRIGGSSSSRCNSDTSDLIELGCSLGEPNSTSSATAAAAAEAAAAAAKAPRMRTVLNDQQLRTLRACYAANPRPDSLMKDRLAEITGLSARVIRVWFQNKRCKDKKKYFVVRHGYPHPLAHPPQPQYINQYTTHQYNNNNNHQRSSCSRQFGDVSNNCSTSGFPPNEIVSNDTSGLNSWSKLSYCYKL